MENRTSERPLLSEAASTSESCWWRHEVTQTSQVGYESYSALYIIPEAVMRHSEQNAGVI